jgi:Holliday junction DNA helicase RuvB
MQQGLVQRTPRGRVLTEGGFRHIGIAPSKKTLEQLDLLGAEEAEDD